jgi:uncharacterized protein YndB with AHSA1/START domain
MTDHVEVSRTIIASPQQLYELVSDLPRMREWSPETTGGSWIKGATGPAVGARFKGVNSTGGKPWTTTSIVDVADPGKEFTFRVVVGPVKVARWSYRFAAVDGTTTVTETWDDQRPSLIRRLKGPARVTDRATHNRAGMVATLDKLAASVER